MIRALLLLALPCFALSLDLTGEGIYWRPAESGFDYAFNTSPSRQVDTLEPNYSWGFAARARLLPTYGDISVQIGGLYIHSSSRAASTGLLLLNPTLLTTVETIRAHLRFRYWNLDIRAALPLFCGRDGSLLWSAGGRYVNLFRQNEARRVGQTSRFRGAGPEVGLQGSFHLASCIGLTGSLTAAALAGRRDHFLARNAPSDTVVIPALESRLALTVSHLCLRADLGYQLDRYWAALLLFRGSSFTTQNRSTEPFGFAGPYASLTLSF